MRLITLEEHETWYIHDSSKVMEYQLCPRKHFFRYELGWVPDTPNIHLVFGESWHRAMEVLLRAGYSNASILIGWAALESYYRGYITPKLDEIYYPKTPEFALPILTEYAEHYKRDEFEVIATETAGAVPISANHTLAFRLDAICRDKLGIFVLDHKTGSKKGEMWSDQWLLSPQMMTYIHVLKCLYPPSEVWGAKINGTFFRSGDALGKKRRDPENIPFQRVIIRKTDIEMEDWLGEMNQWIDKIEQEIQLLKHHDLFGRIMTVFNKRPNACFQYGLAGKCPYFDFCLSWPNPLAHCDEVPAGFKQEWWDPRNLSKDIENIVNFDRHLKKEV